MPRRFQQHILRPVLDLSGVWDFTFLGDVAPDSIDPAGLTCDDVMAAPGCFDATPAYAGRRGLAAYRARVTVAARAVYQLALDGVHHWCRVFINGIALGDHAGGFTAFTLPPVNLEAGDVEIVVLVDNRIDYARGAALHRLGPVWISAVRITTENYLSRQVRVEVDYRVASASGPVPFALRCDGQTLHTETVEFTAQSGTLTHTFNLEDAALWSPDAPNLHLLDVQLGADDQRERFGIRQIRVADRQILINEQPLRLLGFNRHEIHTEFGHGLPDALLVEDIHLLRDMGCNFVRGSHYPQATRFLDLCDELGLLVWVEATGWQQTAEHLTDPHFIAAQLTNIGEMVASAHNHPSVIMWGVLNEGHSHKDAARPGYATVMEHLRQLDHTRPVTFATNHPFDDVCLDLADIVSVNCYPGWYDQDIEDIPAHLDAIAQHIDATGHAHKPLIISEIGAGAIYGWRDSHAGHWSEQYQARLLETVITHMFQASTRFMGLAIWQFCDIRSSEERSRALFRPRNFNNKGVVDEYRRPKLAYDVVKRLFNALRP